MLRPPAPFLSTMLFAVLVPAFLVMTTAFITVPYNLGGHFGDLRTSAPSSATRHLS